MRPKHIWIVNQYAGSRIHGMEFRHYHLARELTDQGHNVTIISGSFSHLHKVRPATTGAFTLEDIDGITYCWVKTPPYGQSVSAKRVINMVAFAVSLCRLPLKKLARPDAIIVSSPSLFPIAIGYHWKKRFKANLFFEIRDVWPLTLQELGGLSSRHPLVVLMRWFERYGYRKADRVVSLLPNAEDHFVKSGMDRSKFAYIPNGISESEIQQSEPLSDSLRSLLPRDRFIVGYTGTLGMANALENVVEAASILKDDSTVHFVLVGQGSEKASLQALASGLRNISFIDVIPKLQVQDMIRHFDVCYIGLRKHPLFSLGVSPNKLFDYMYSGRPIIYAIDSGNKPVDDAKCGITIESASAKALADAVLLLKNMPDDQRRLMGENGRKYVLEQHSYAALARKYAEIM